MTVEITSRGELKAWLEDKPREWAQVIALRSALRAAPIALDPNQWKDGSPDLELSQAIFRAMAVSSAATKIPVDGTVRAAANDAAANDAAASDAAAYAANTAYASDAASDAAANTAYAASDAAAYAAYAANTAYASDAAAHAAADASDADSAAYAAAYAADAAAYASASASARVAVWRVIEKDCQALEKGTSPDKLQRLHLWPDAPDWWSDTWDAARKWLSREEDGFEIWREWYFGRLKGLPHAFADFDDEADEAFYRWIVEKDNDWWKREPAEINREIAKFVDSLRKPQDAPQDTPKDAPKDTGKPPVDFFISYANEDEAAARDIAKVLDDLGKSYLIQYRDFPQSNFLNAMNEAMERADRLIPVYSKSYAASDFCKAEWNHFFKLDPSGAERRIVGFKLDGADLTPLMEQVVYEKLSGVPRGDWGDVIRNWVSWQPLSLTRDNIAQTTTETLDPGVSRDATGKLHSAPKFGHNQPPVPAQLEQAMASLRMMLELIGLNQQNLSSMMQGALKLYYEHLNEHGNHPSWDGLDRYVAVLAEGSLSMSSSELREEKKALEQFIAAHKQCLAALKQAPYQERELANVPLDNATSEVIDAFIESLKQFRTTAQARDVITKEYDLQAKNLIQQGSEFAFEAGAPDAAEKPDIARKRFLRYVGGFAIRTLTVLGSIASIRSTPEGKGLIDTAKALVEKFYEMIGL